jgi:AhpD family alkylhydroperoxidase
MIVNSTSEDEGMEPRINMMTNQLGANIVKRIYNVSPAIEQSPLPKATQHLVMLRASQINGCAFCVDIHTKEAAAANELGVRLHLVGAWRHATVFTEAERAALALTEEGTRLADAHQGPRRITARPLDRRHRPNGAGVRCSRCRRRAIAPGCRC